MDFAGVGDGTNALGRLRVNAIADCGPLWGGEGLLSHHCSGVFVVSPKIRKIWKVWATIMFARGAGIPPGSHASLTALLRFVCFAGVGVAADGEAALRRLMKVNVIARFLDVGGVLVNPSLGCFQDLMKSLGRNYPCEGRWTASGVPGSRIPKFSRRSSPSCLKGGRKGGTCESLS